MKHRWWLLGILSVWLVWDWAASNPEVSMFLVYARQENQSYNWDAPLVPVDVLSNGLVTEVNCATLPLVQRGVWYVVVVALGRDGARSDPSNEISFRWNPPEGCMLDDLPEPGPPAPSLPPGGKPPVPVLPPLSTLYPPVVMKPPVYPPWPQPTQGLGDLTENCAWKGCNATPPPAKGGSPGAITDSPLWRGQSR